MGRPRKNNSTYYSNNQRQILEAAAMTTQLKYGDIMKFMVIDKNDLTQMAWYAQGVTCVMRPIVSSGVS